MKGAHWDVPRIVGKSENESSISQNSVLFLTFLGLGESIGESELICNYSCYVSQQNSILQL